MSNDLGVRLREAKDSLASWYDQLNAKWAEAEAFLRTINLSEPVWTPFHGETQSSEPGGPFGLTVERDFSHCLTFQKAGREWHICYAVGEVGCPEDFIPRPILECSLETRKMALQGLPKLLADVVAQAETEASALESALGAASEALASLKR